MTQAQRRRAWDERGASLIEVMIGMLMLTSALLGLASTAGLACGRRLGQARASNCGRLRSGRQTVWSRSIRDTVGTLNQLDDALTVTSTRSVLCFDSRGLATAGGQ